MTLSSLPVTLALMLSFTGCSFLDEQVYLRDEPEAEFLWPIERGEDPRRGSFASTGFSYGRSCGGPSVSVSFRISDPGLSTEEVTVVHFSARHGDGKWFDVTKNEVLKVWVNQRRRVARGETTVGPNEALEAFLDEVNSQHVLSTMKKTHESLSPRER